MRSRGAYSGAYSGVYLPGGPAYSGQYSGNTFSPAALAPYAWYDAELGQPKNVGYVELTGVSGDYVFTPDSAGLSFSNDIEVVMRVRVTDWTAAANQTLCGKYVTTGNQRSWRFYVSTTGAIVLTASANGTAVTSVTVTPTVAFTDGAWIWLRLRLDLTNGANSVGTVETAADTGSNVEPSSWTANGTATGTTIAGVFDGTAALEIGTFQSGTSERLAGRVGRCIVRSGFAGSTGADFNADDCYLDGVTDSVGNVWSVANAKVYDRSANARAAVVNASGSNAAAPLSWRGVPSVHIEAAGAGINGVSCTAPAGTASYSAVPRDGGSPSTGVAAPGAFSFTTAGDWQYVSLLNGSAVEVARYAPASSTQAGHTDSYGVVWAVDRGTSGRKSVVQSHAATSARSVFLLGTDDYLTVPAAAVPPMAASDAATILVVGRTWGTPPSLGCFFHFGQSGGALPLLLLRENGGGPTLQSFIQDGSGSAFAYASFTNSQRFVIGVALAAATVRSIANSNEASAARGGVAISPASPVATIGAYAGSAYQDFEWEAVLTFSRALTASEIGQIVAYYRGAA